MNKHLRAILQTAWTYFGKSSDRRFQLSHYQVVIFLISILVFSELALAQENRVNFDAVYTGEVWANTKGGVDTGTRYLSNIDLLLDAQIGYGTLFLHGFYTNGTTFSDELVGDLQVVSSIDNSQVYRLLEAWYSREFYGGALMIKSGLIDLNTEFDAVEPAGFFINSSHGIGLDFSQTGENGPSIFPSTSLAAFVNISPVENWSARFGIFDAVPNDPDNPDRMKITLGDGALLVGEVDYFTPADFRLAAGAWKYTSDFEVLDPAIGNGEMQDGNWGAYASVSGNVYSSNDRSQIAASWLRYGFADNTDINFVKSYLGAGIVFTGFIPSRPDDQIGMAVASAFIGSPAKSVAKSSGEAVSNAETSIELTYRTEITDWISLQPNIQYIVNPGIVGDLPNALVIGLRFEVAAGF